MQPATIIPRPARMIDILQDNHQSVAYVKMSWFEQS